MSPDELKTLISLCWDAASQAQMAGLNYGMFLPIIGTDGQPIMSNVRWTTYQILLQNLVPKREKTETTLYQPTPKEPWQDG